MCTVAVSFFFDILKKVGTEKEEKKDAIFYSFGADNQPVLLTLSLFKIFLIQFVKIKHFRKLF